MAGKLISVAFEVFGRVQGVWFRKYTKNAAQALKLVGWVMNTKHSTVVGCIQGEKKNVTKMKEWLQHQGSPKSKIEKCEFRDEKNIDSLQFTNFEVRR
ncbi:acylphosphatase-1-like [Hydractinia symbiolongicarpus]|uniref:acylphosphatase-1-like n=1 Tax=Hydractinia symbiolongicarpus TaxID=13093 RepID=UPI002551A0DF|nr:acylphosphatase-1-like [Hydractinia symbiolongicarpus]